MGEIPVTGVTVVTGFARCEGMRAATHARVSVGGADGPGRGATRIVAARAFEADRESRIPCRSAHAPAARSLRGVQP
jgi:hypothetical protein